MKDFRLVRYKAILAIVLPIELTNQLGFGTSLVFSALLLATARVVFDNCDDFY